MREYSYFSSALAKMRKEDELSECEGLNKRDVFLKAPEIAIQRLKNTKVNHLKNDKLKYVLGSINYQSMTRQEYQYYVDFHIDMVTDAFIVKKEVTSCE